MGDKPAVSVIVIADYGGRAAEDWNYLRDTLGALHRQVFDERVEVLLIDATPPDQQMPADVIDLVRSLRVFGGSGETTCTLLNTAAQAAAGEFVALLDGDCAPAPGWLRAAVDAMRARPDAAAVSGLTRYPDTGLSARLLAVLSRSFVDPGGPGPTRFITSNNAILRGDVLRAHPLPAYARPLAMRLQAEAIQLTGGTVYFEPSMRVTHRFEGWAMERRIRRHIGYRAVRVRQLDQRVPHAWVVRLGICSIPVVVAARTFDSCWDCLRAGRDFGLRWFDLPVAIAFAVAVHLLEIGGMRAAFQEARSNGVTGHAVPQPKRGEASFPSPSRDCRFSPRTLGK